MGWLRGRYYIRSTRRDGRVIHKYIGGGELGELAAAEDASQRAEREERAAAWRTEKGRWEALNALLDEVCKRIDLLVRATLMAAGYHQHKRGEWRKRRAPKPKA